LYNPTKGEFNKLQFDELKNEHDNFELGKEIEFLDRDFVSMIWFIPTFISWQEERLLNNNINSSLIQEISNYFYNKCEEILGIP